MTKMPPAKAKGLQELLNKIVQPDPPLKVDGVIGPKSVEALKKFQSKAGLKQTGEVDGDTAVVVARAMKTGKLEKDPPTIFVDLGGGKYAGFTEKEWEQARKRAIDNLLRGPVREMKMKAEMAMTEWEHFDALNSDQYVVSFLIELTRGQKLPPKGTIAKAVAVAAEMERLAKSGDFQGFCRRAPGAAKEVNEALTTMRSYREEMIEGGGNWVTGLETTKWVAFTSLSVYFAPVVGASMGASAVATAVVGGAAIKGVESAAGEIGNWSAGNLSGQGVGGSISRVLIDTAVGAVGGILSKGMGGKAVGDVIFGKISEGIIKKLAIDGVSKTVVQKLTTWFLAEGGKKVLEGAVSDAAKALKGDPKMTIGTFAENIAANFLKGCALGPFNNAFKAFSKGRTPPMDDSTRKKVQKQIEDKVLKEVGNNTIHIKQFQKLMDEKWDKLASDTIAKALSKGMEKIAPAVIDKLKGQPNEAAITKAIQNELYTDALLNECRDLVADELIKELKKKKK